MQEIIYYQDKPEVHELDFRKYGMEMDDFKFIKAKSQEYRPLKNQVILSNAHSINQIKDFDGQWCLFLEDEGENKKDSFLRALKLIHTFSVNKNIEVQVMAFEPEFIGVEIKSSGQMLEYETKNQLLTLKLKGKVEFVPIKLPNFMNIVKKNPKAELRDLFKISVSEVSINR